MTPSLQWAGYFLSRLEFLGLLDLGDAVFSSLPFVHQKILMAKSLYSFCRIQP